MKNDRDSSAHIGKRDVLFPQRSVENIVHRNVCCEVETILKVYNKHAFRHTQIKTLLFLQELVAGRKLS